MFFAAKNAHFHALSPFFQNMLIECMNLWVVKMNLMYLSRQSLKHSRFVWWKCLIQYGDIFHDLQYNCFGLCIGWNNALDCYDERRTSSKLKSNCSFIGHFRIDANVCANEVDFHQTAELIEAQHSGIMKNSVITSRLLLWDCISFYFPFVCVAGINDVRLTTRGWDFPCSPCSPYLHVSCIDKVQLMNLWKTWTFFWSP